MRNILAAVVAAALFAPSICVAGVLTFRVQDALHGELPVSFGLDPFRLSADATGLDVDLQGTVNIVSGPLISQTVDPSTGYTTYVYGVGVLTLEGSGSADDGTDVTGSFTAPTEMLEFIVEEGTDDIFGGGRASVQIFLMAGLFDPALAKLLHVQRTTTGGEIGMRLDGIDGGLDTFQRVGFSESGDARLTIDTLSVPEPALLGLGLTSAIGWIALRRRKRGQMVRTGRVT